MDKFSSSDMHVWLLNGIAYCLIHLAIVIREDKTLLKIVMPRY